MAYQQNEFQKQMLKEFPEFEKTLTTKRDKPLTKEEKREAYKKAYENDF